MRALAEAPFVDIFAPEFLDDPSSSIEALQQRTGLVCTPIGGMVIRRALVQDLLSDRRLRSSLLDTVRMQGVTDGIIPDLIGQWLYALEGEDHQRLRALVGHAFTQRSVDAYRPIMRQIVASLVAPLATAGRCEFMSDVADQYPIRVMCHILGVPEEDRSEFTAWIKAVRWLLSLELGPHREEVEWGAHQLSDYVDWLIKARRDEPGRDLVTALVGAETQDGRLSEGELRSMILGLLFSGFETTRNQLGLAMAVFADHPEQWAMLAERRELVPQAVEEVMRFRGAVGVAPRIAVEPLEVDGYLVAAGTHLVLSTASANHDPACYRDPGTFDMTVGRAPHLSFGGGPHFCLGANLARAEMQEALPILAAHMPGLEIEAEPTWRSPLGIVGPERLPLRFGHGS
jgi:cytochrome P450